MQGKEGEEGGERYGKADISLRGKNDQRDPAGARDYLLHLIGAEKWMIGQQVRAGPASLTKELEKTQSTGSRKDRIGKKRFHRPSSHRRGKGSRMTGKRGERRFIERGTFFPVSIEGPTGKDTSTSIQVRGISLMVEKRVVTKYGTSRCWRGSARGELRQKAYEKALMTVLELSREGAMHDWGMSHGRSKKGGKTRRSRRS